MRLTCPNCGAQYEVPDEVIPHDGRDVQCSNCGMTWFQAHRDNPDATAQDAAQDTAQNAEAVAEAEPDLAETAFSDTEIDEAAIVDPEFVEPAYDETGYDDDRADDAHADDDDDDHDGGPDFAYEGEDELDDVAAAQTGPTRRGIDPDVADILRQEAEHEAELRATEDVGGLESQPNLGLDDLPTLPDALGDDAAERVARMRSDIPVADDNGSRRDLLPDIDEINSSLRSDSDSTALTNRLDDDTNMPVPPVKSGFSRGFAITLVLALAIVLIYANAPEISARVPQADSFLNALVAIIDKGRLWLDSQVRSFVS